MTAAPITWSTIGPRLRWRVGDVQTRFDGPSPRELGGPRPFRPIGRVRHNGEFIWGGHLISVSGASSGPFSLLVDLPVWRTQRSPSRFLVLTVFAFTVCGAIGWQRLWETRIARWPHALPAIASVAALLVAVDAWVESRPWQSAAHIPVLKDEVLEAFQDIHIEVFFDGTLGAGGHAKEILEAHPEIKTYIGCDKDEIAMTIAGTSSEYNI